MNNITPEDIRNAKREYLRRWRQENPEKVSAINLRYWEKKVAEMKAAGKEPKHGNL